LKIIYFYFSKKYYVHNPNIKGISQKIGLAPWALIKMRREIQLVERSKILVFDRREFQGFLAQKIEF